MPSDDPKFERALAQHLRGGSAQANCPDAETLAAYHERNLSLEEMAQWKEHISACEACQEALALVETTENQLAEVWEERGIPVLEAASIQRAGAAGSPKLSANADASTAPQSAATRVAILRRRPALLRWAIPLGAVAAGVLVFIGIYEQRASKVAHYSDTVIARRQEPATPGPMLDEQKNKLQSQLQPKNERAISTELSTPEEDQDLPAMPLAKPVERAKVAGDAERESRNALAGGRFEKKTATPPPPAPNLPVQSYAGEAVSENAPAIAAAPRPAPPSAPQVLGGIGGGVPAQKAPSHADAKNVPSSVTQTVTVESAAPPIDTSTSSMMMKQGVANQVVEVTGADVAGLILTPDNRVFWKLQSTGTVQLTTDGGKDWKSLETGANVDLTTGFAPSSSVCWIAGKSGTLLLTKDRGRHWTRISTPIAGDLGGVHAADAKHASIWDAARHTSYETSDGGSTWKQTTNK
jgi:Photosynthesis system II assembly factor YCF48